MHPHSGNPRLAYDFRATPDPAIDLNVHHERPFAVISLPLLILFSLLPPLPSRNPFCIALVFTNRPHLIILHKAICSNLAACYRKPVQL
jgi:hypothetical protein